MSDEDLHVALLERLAERSTRGLRQVFQMKPNEPIFFRVEDEDRARRIAARLSEDERNRVIFAYIDHGVMVWHTF